MDEGVEGLTHVVILEYGLVARGIVFPVKPIGLEQSEGLRLIGAPLVILLPNIHRLQLTHLNVEPVADADDVVR